MSKILKNYYQDQFSKLHSIFQIMKLTQLESCQSETLEDTEEVLECNRSWVFQKLLYLNF